MKTSATRSGHYEQFGEHNHFVPAKLPPVPSLELDNDLLELYGETMQSLGKFNESFKRIPGQLKFFFRQFE